MYLEDCFLGARVLRPLAYNPLRERVFIHDGRPFTSSDWKNAGRQSRQNLPEPAVWMPWVEDMEEAWVGPLCPCA